MNNFEWSSKQNAMHNTGTKCTLGEHFLKATRVLLWYTSGLTGVVQLYFCRTPNTTPWLLSVQEQHYTSVTVYTFTCCGYSQLQYYQYLIDYFFKYFHASLSVNHSLLNYICMQGKNFKIHVPFADKPKILAGSPALSGTAAASLSAVNRILQGNYVWYDYFSNPSSSFVAMTHSDIALSCWRHSRNCLRF